MPRRHCQRSWDLGGSAISGFAATDRGFFSKRKVTKFRDIQDGLSNTIAMAEIVTDIGTRDIRGTLSITQSGPHGSGWTVEDNPSWCVDQGHIQPDDPSFWCDDPSAGCTPPVRIAENANGRGMNWAWAAMGMTNVNTIRPPNSEVCFNGWYDNVGNAPASSNHQGGAHVLMGDGAVIFMTDSVEAGDQRETNRGARNRRGSFVNTPYKKGKQRPYGLWGALGSKNGKETIEEQLNQ